jgi:hypothetical protein
VLKATLTYLYLLSLLLITPLGFYLKAYSGPFSFWINNSLTGVMYEIFWCLAIGLFFQRISPWKISFEVLIATCLLECSQLLHPPILEYIRASFIGRTILGTTFVWSDFIYYIIGSVIGGVWIEGIRQLQKALSHKKP